MVTMSEGSPIRIPRVLVLRPDTNCGPARLVGWAEQAGVALDVRDARTAGALGPELQACDGFIVLGGPMGDGDTLLHPWLEDLRGLLRDATSFALPTLGICLGAQLLASALGGEVRPGAHGLETGVVPLEIESDAVTDQLLRGINQAFLSGAMHQDAITELPPEAALLVTGERYPNQAFRVSNSWGVQFHPEIGPLEYSAWKAPVCESRPGFEREFDQTVAEFARCGDLVEGATSQLVSNFFGAVREAVRVRSSGVRNG